MGGIQGRDSQFASTILLLNPRRAVRRPHAVSTVFFFLLFLGLSFVLSGCASGSKIDNVNLPFVTVKKTVISRLPLATVREESLNGRELLSAYFNPTNLDEDATDLDERAYAKAVILGAGRPYSIQVSVIREKRRRNKYEKLGTDQRLSKELLERIRAGLADRRDDRNVIDDFRAF